jgi:heptose I phosphotransferase
MGTLEIQSEYRALLEAGGLGTFEALFAAGERERIDGHRQRSASRVELVGPDGRPVIIYLKRQWGAAARPSWRDLLDLRRPLRPAEREWRNARRLLAMGIAVSAPVAWGFSRGPGGPRSLIAFREVNGPSLAWWLRQAAQSPDYPPPALRRAVAEAIGKAVLGLHEAGISFPDLYAKHVYLEGLEAGRPRVVLIDVARLRPLTRRRRWQDLAALHATTGMAGVQPRDRLRVLRAYFGDSWRQAVQQVEQMADRMRGRGQDPRLKAARQVPGAAAEIVSLDGGRLLVNAAFRPALQAAGLATFDAVMNLRGGEAYRDVPGRLTVRIEIPDTRGGKHALFVKRYTERPRGLGLRRMLGLAEEHSAADRELRNLYRVIDIGIPAMRWVAVGEDRPGGRGARRSFLVTEEIAGATQADDYCEAAFGRDRSRRAAGAKRRLVTAIARLARRFHQGGLVHRDFYLCHVLVRPAEGAEPQLHLIDLARVTHHRGGPAGRWTVKDLASLLFSSWPSPATGIRSPVFTRTDAVRFAREYFHVPRLEAAHKRLIRRIAAKARRIAQHEERRRRRPCHGVAPASREADP